MQIIEVRTLYLVGTLNSFSVHISTTEQNNHQTNLRNIIVKATANPSTGNTVFILVPRKY